MNEPYARYRGTPAIFILGAINVVVFLLWQVAPALMQQHFVVSLDAVQSGRIWTVFTTMFSHQEIFHLLFNMLALWVFGQSVERVMGPVKFTMLFLAGGLAGAVGHLVWSMFAVYPVGALGASGAVMAIGAVYGMWFPNRTLLINMILPLPAWLAVVLYIAMDVFGMVGSGGNVAHAAHLGGAALGLLVGLPRLIQGRRA